MEKAAAGVCAALWSVHHCAGLATTPRPGSRSLALHAPLCGVESQFHVDVSWDLAPSATDSTEDATVSCGGNLAPGWK